MDKFSQTALAKVNLTLHVAPVNERGFHPLQSLVVFADVGDILSAVPAKNFSLKIDGPFANGLPTGPRNLVLKAASQCAFENDLAINLSYKLTKYLPPSSGIGGGSADAAAAVRLLAAYNQQTPLGLDEMLRNIGADVSVCYHSQTCMMEGVGETITPLLGLGKIAAVLVNPNIPISTAAIFKVFDASGISSKFNQKPGTLLGMARAGTNDLQDTAIGMAPVIQTVLDQIQTQYRCQLARMSGSGATCFGLFETYAAAQAAAKKISDVHPDWWCVPTMLGD